MLTAVLLVAVVLAGAAGWGSEVIAAPLVIDQPDAVDVPTAAPTPTPSADAPVTPEPAAFTAGDAVLIIVALAVLGLFFAFRWHRLDAAPKQPVAFSPGAGILLAVAMWLLAPIGAAAAQYLFGVQPPGATATPSSMPIEQVAQLTIGVYAAQAVALGIFIWLHLQAPPLASDQRWRPLSAIGLGIAALVLAWPVVLAAAGIAALLRGDPTDPIAHETLRQLVENQWTGWSVTLAALVVFVAPVMEEVMYRGLVQRSFVRAGFSQWMAIVITSAIFALMHWTSVDPHAIVALFVLALALGWAYEKSGRLIAPITMHMLFNFCNLAMARTMAAA